MKKFKLSLLALVSSLMFIIFAFVGCGNKTYTVTFKNGEETVTVDVKAGKDLLKSAEMPKDPVMDGYEFDGWFFDGVKIGDSYIPEEDVVLTAKFTKIHTLTFKNGEETVKEVKHRDKDTLAIVDIPEDPTKDGYEFDGWFIGEKELEAGYVFEADAVVEAKFTKIHTLTFKNSDETVKEVKHRNNDTLALDEIPANPAKDGAEFDGWYVGDTKVEEGYVFTADAVAEAKFTNLFTVKFVNGEEVVKTATVRDGELIADEDIPGDLEKVGYTFDGWFKGDVAFDETVAVIENVVYEAKFTKSSYFVTFKNGEEEKLVYVDMKANTLKATDIPAEPKVDGKVFLGWYTADVRAEDGAKITADTVFTPAYVAKADYAGVWTNSEKKMNVLFDGTNITVNKDTKNIGFTFDEKAGNITFKTGGTFDRKNWSGIILNGKLTLTLTYYDTTYEENVTEKYVFEKCQAVDYAGKYTNNKKNIVITDGGVVTEFDGSIEYAKMYKEGDAYVLEYKANGSLNKAQVTIDEKGNLVVVDEKSASKCGIYVKGVESVNKYTFDGADGYYYIYNYTVSGKSLLVYTDKDNVSSYAQLAKDIVLNEENTLTVNGKDLVVMFTDADSFAFPRDERGTLAGAAGDMYLDGFGKAKFEGKDVEYKINKSGVLVIGEKGYTIDLTAKTYVEKVADVYKGKYTNTDIAKRSIVIDGLGGIIFYNYSTPNEGGYTVADGKITIKECNGSIDGTYTFTEGNNVLLHSSDATKTYIKDGYTVVSQEDKFIGWWKDANGKMVVIDKDTSTIAYGDETVSYKANWNGTELTFSATDEKVSTSYKKCDFTATVSGDTLTLVHNRITGYDATYEEYITEKITETFTKTEAPKLEKDAYAGAWTGKLAVSNIKVYFDGYGKGFFDNGSAIEITYTVKDNTVTFNALAWEFVLTADSTNKKLTGTATEEYESPLNVEITVNETADAFMGQWISADKGTMITFDGMGNVHYKDKWSDFFKKYTIEADGRAKFWDDYDENVYFCAILADGSMKLNDYYVYNKIVDEKKDGYEGTWTGTFAPAKIPVTITFDGNGKGTLDKDGIKDTFTYTVKGNTVTFRSEKAYMDFTVTGDPATGTLSLSITDDDYYTYNGSVTKA